MTVCANLTWEPPGTVIVLCVVSALGVASLGVAATASLLLPGQLGDFLPFGYNMESGKILSECSMEESIWLNDGECGDLVRFYRGEYAEAPEQYCRVLQTLPARETVLHPYEMRTHSFAWTDTEAFRRQAEERNISRISLLVSELADRKFVMQDRLQDLNKADWLVLEKTVPLKNKTLYVFRVVEKENQPARSSTKSTTNEVTSH